MANKIESIETFPGQHAGHLVVSNFKHEAGKKEGALAGGVYIERAQARGAPIWRVRAR